MSDRVAIKEIVQAYEAYEKLAAALGFRVRKGAVRRHALTQLGYRGEMKSFFSRAYAERHPDRTAPGRACEAVRQLLRDLAAPLSPLLGKRGRVSSLDNGHLQRLCEMVARLNPAERQTLCTEIEHSPQAVFLYRQECPIAEFHQALRDYAQGQTIARGKLINYLCGQLRARGINMSRASIEERFRRNTKVRTVPPALVELVHTLGPEFRTGLVPIETLVGDQPPAEWLAATCEQLHFRSKNAMHRALAEATSVNYETVHKALTRPRPGQRIQKEIVDTLIAWREAVRRGERLPVKPAYLSATASSGEVAGLLRRLSRRTRSPSELYRAGARALAVGRATVRGLMHGAPATHLSGRSVKALKELVKERESAARIHTYLSGRDVRRMARALARRAELARQAWRAHPEDDALREAFKRRRLELIVAIREGFDPAALCPEPDHAEALD